MSAWRQHLRLERNSLEKEVQVALVEASLARREAEESWEDAEQVAAATRRWLAFFSVAVPLVGMRLPCEVVAAVASFVLPIAMRVGHRGRLPGPRAWWRGGQASEMTAVLRSEMRMAEKHSRKSWKREEDLRLVLAVKKRSIAGGRLAGVAWIYEVALSRFLLQLDAVPPRG